MPRFFRPPLLSLSKQNIDLTNTSKLCQVLKRNKTPLHIFDYQTDLEMPRFLVDFVIISR